MKTEPEKAKSTLIKTCYELSDHETMWDVWGPGKEGGQWQYNENNLLYF